MNEEVLSKKVYEFATTSDSNRIDELLEEITLHYLELYNYERTHFSDTQKIDLDDYGQDEMLSNYQMYLISLFMGIRERSTVEFDKLNADLEDNITMLMIVYVAIQFSRINITEKSNVKQTAQLSVVQQIQTSNTDVKITKTWISRNDSKTCPICRALHGTTVPVGENFLVNGQVVELHDGTRFVYNYLDRNVAIAHPNDRCRIEFNIEQD